MSSPIERKRTVTRETPPPAVTEGPSAGIRSSSMKRILSLSALGLLLLAGTSTAQQPAAGGSASSTPVVQSAVTSSAPSSTGRFGRARGTFTNSNRTGLFGRRSNRTSGNVVSADTTPPTTQPQTEGIPMPKTTPKEMKTQTPPTKPPPLPPPPPPP